jgi:hypothetical protein
MKPLFYALLAASVLPLAACGDATEPGATTGVDEQYVLSGVDLPMDGNSADAVAMEIAGHKGNQLGNVFGTLQAVGLDFHGVAAGAVTSGDAVTLINVRTDDLAKDDQITVSVLAGMPMHPPVFDGSGAFTVDPHTTPPGLLLGSARAGHLSVGAAAAILRLAVESPDVAPALELPFLTARVEMTTGSSCSGVIAGAVSQAWISAVFVPAILDKIQRIVAERDASDALVQLILGQYDVNGDKQVSLDELQNNDFTKMLLTPDLTVDGQPALSFATAFSCAQATFTPPSL